MVNDHLDIDKAYENTRFLYGVFAVKGL